MLYSYVRIYSPYTSIMVCHTLDLDDLAEDLFLSEEEEDLPCSEDSLSEVISPSESEGKSFSSSSELSVAL